MLSADMDEKELKELKALVQCSYMAWLNHHNLKPRKSQQQMMDAIVEALAAIELDKKSVRKGVPSVVVLEAGTGTGKTIAYLIAAWHCAQKLKKKLIVSTATVTLQNQLIEKDLFSLKEVLGRQLKYALAKGQKRYCCVSRLNQHVSKHPPTVAYPELDKQFSATPEDRDKLYPDMLDRFNNKQWAGDFDSWPKIKTNKPISSESQKPVAFDLGDCTKKGCDFFQGCPYFTACKQVRSANLIVTNHDLLITYLTPRAEPLLPTPEEAIYVIDEGHWILEQAYPPLELNIGTTSGWLDGIDSALGRLNKASKDVKLKELTTAYKGSAEALMDGLSELQTFAQQQFADHINPGNRQRYVHGILPAELADIIKRIQTQTESVKPTIKEVEQYIREVADGHFADRAISASQAKDYLPVIKSLRAKLFQAWELLDDYAAAPVANGTAEDKENKEDHTTKAATAGDIQVRWLSQDNQKKDNQKQAGYILHSSPATAAPLPASEEAGYAADAGQRISEQAPHHELNIGTTHGWLIDLYKALREPGKAAKDVKLKQLTVAYKGPAEALMSGLGDLQTFIQQRLTNHIDPGGHRIFAHGILPWELADIIKRIQAQAELVEPTIKAAEQYIQGVADGYFASEAMAASQAKAHLPAIKSLKAKLFQAWELLADYAAATADKIQVRWLSQDNQKRAGYILHSSPATSGHFLHEKLWSKACGAIVTSATLQALGNFDFFRLHSGMPKEGVRYDALPSSFKFAEKSRLVMPKKAKDAGYDKTGDLHTDSLVRLLPCLIKPETGTGTLVLFSSKDQLQKVFERLPKRLQKKILRQHDYGASKTLGLHRARINKGETSVLFGLTSFAHGIDLPGDQCCHVIITKLPFQVPTEPIFAALAEWFEASGDNSFEKLSLPMASIRLIQAAGRLLRTETDSGQITLLDKRILTKRYGPDLLAALPPAKRQLDELCIPEDDRHPW